MAYLMTEEHKKAISKGLKGKMPKNIASIKGWNKNKKASLETRKKQSLIALKQNHTGNKNPMWRGGSWVYWQRVIKRRDRYICQICGLFDVDIIEAAHIIPLDGPNTRTISGNPLNSLENLISLCPNCHKRYDKGLVSL